MNYSRQREVVEEVVKQSCDHPTAEQVYQRAKEVLPSIGMATVYRNLNTLAEHGAIRRISLPGESDRFDCALEEHDHAVCIVCNKIFDIYSSPDEKKRALRAKGNLPEGFQPIESSVIVYGYCKDCKNKKD